MAYNRPRRGSGKIKSSRKGRSERYWRFVKGRADILARSSLTKNMDRRTIIKIAQTDLKPILKDYAKARHRSYELYNNPYVRVRLNRKFGDSLGDQNWRALLREAHAQQADIRRQLTSNTGIGLGALLSPEEKIQGES